MIIFRRELKRNRISFFIWTILTVLLIFSQMAVFPSFIEDSTASQEALLARYPEALVDVFGIAKIDMSNVLGYFAVKLFPLIALIGSIYTMLLASGILSKELDEKTAEFLLSKPISRSYVVAGKVSCALFYTILYNLILFVSTYAMMEIYKTDVYSFSDFTTLWVSLLLLNTAFSSLGFLLAIFVTKTKTNYPISIGIVLGSYLISVISSGSEKTESLKYLSFFKYSDASEILINGRISSVYIALFAMFIILSCVVSFISFNKKRIVV